jgi:hypothetical protein
MQMPTCDLFSFHYASVGYFLAIFLIDTSFFLYLGFHIMITLSSKSMFELGKLGDLISAEWLFGFGLVWYLPGLFEAALEYGGFAEGIRRVLLGFDTTQKFRLSTPFYWFLTAVFFNFQNKTKAGAIRQSINSGVAQYIATGRPNADARLHLLDTFLQYRKLQFHDAVLFLAYFIAYKAADLALSDALPMITLLFCTLSWLVAPVLFAPYHTWKSLFADLKEFWEFLTRNPADKSRASMVHMRGRWLAICAAGFKPASQRVTNKHNHKGQPPNLFEVCLEDALFADQRAEHKIFTDTVALWWSLLRLVILLTVLPSSVLEGFELYLAAWIIHLALALTKGAILDLGTMFILVLLCFFALVQSSDLGTMLFSSLLFFQLLDTVAKVLLYFSRMLRRVGILNRSVTAKNVVKGMTVIPGPDWKWDMSKNDAKQNAAPGCRTIGTVTSCDQKEMGFCEVAWMHGSSGRYRIKTKKEPNCDLIMHPDWNAVMVEAVTLLCGQYHLHLFIGYVVMVVWGAVGAVLCLVDMNFFGGWHSSMLRVPTRQQMKKADEVELSIKKKQHGESFAGRGTSGPLEDNIVLADLQRDPWNDHIPNPKAKPIPSSFIKQDPSFVEAGWKEVIRVQVPYLDHLKGRVTLQNLRSDFGMVAVALESKDEVECTPDTALEEKGYLLFGFENNEERWGSLGAFLNIDKETHERDGDYEKRCSGFAEKVCLPVYTFEIPPAWVGRDFGDLTGTLKFICGIRRANKSYGWFPDLKDSFRQGDGVILSQGNARSFAHYRAKALFGDLALGAGWRQLYSVAAPHGQFGDFSRFRDDSGRLGPILAAKVVGYIIDEFPGVAWVCKSGYRTSQSPRVWPLCKKYGIIPIEYVQDHRGVKDEDKVKSGSRLLLGFESNVTREQQLCDYLDIAGSNDSEGRGSRESCCPSLFPAHHIPAADAATRMEEFVEWKWHPVVNFRVPDAWKDKTIAEVMYDMVKQDGVAIPIVAIYRRSRWARMRDPKKPSYEKYSTRALSKMSAHRSKTGLLGTSLTKALDSKSVKVTDAERERALAEGQSAGVALAADLRQALWFPGVRETFEIADEAVIILEHGRDFLRMLKRLENEDELERATLPDPDKPRIPPVSNVLRPGYIEEELDPKDLLSSWGVRPLVRGGSDSQRPERPARLPTLPELGESDCQDFVVWVMLDCRTSEIGVYPAQLAEPIEKGWRKRDDMVSLYEYGHQTTVYVRRMEQVSEGKGKCDIRRVRFTESQHEITLQVVRGKPAEAGKPGAWRFSDDPAHCEERRAKLHSAAILAMPALRPGEGWDEK